jgi:hypothetical protein
MAYDFDENIVSDLHKDARGYRPREYFWAEWNNSTNDERQMIWDSLIRELNAEMERERAAEARAILNLQARICETRALGAASDAEAVRWILEAEGLNEHDLAYGADYVAWHFGLPYGNPFKLMIQETIDQLRG